MTQSTPILVDSRLFFLSDAFPHNWQIFIRSQDNSLILRFVSTQIVLIRPVIHGISLSAENGADSNRLDALADFGFVFHKPYTIYILEDSTRAKHIIAASHVFIWRREPSIVLDYDMLVNGDWEPL